MTDTVQKIVAMEWNMFDRVRSRGGRAACQDDPKTFSIMRSSQLEAWDSMMQESYYMDLKAAQREGRNLLSEKYGYMMERTNPSEYAQIKGSLPARIPEKEQLIDRICQAHVAWLESVAERYPLLTGRGRAIHRSEDSAAATSFETYLWGELATYSVVTVRLYAVYIEQLKMEGRNMNEMILRNTAARYGYASLEQAERQLAGQT